MPTSTTTGTTHTHPFVRYISGNLKIADLTHEINYARAVINASRYPQPDEFHIYTIPVFLVSRDDMDELYPPEKKVEPIPFVAERIVKDVLESFFKVNAIAEAERATRNPLNSVLKYVVCEADISALSEDERNALENAVKKLINGVETVLKEVFRSVPFENIQVNNNVVSNLVNQIRPLIEKFLNGWLHFNNGNGLQGLDGIINRALEARKIVVAQGLYCGKNPDSRRFYKDAPGDYEGQVIFLCPDRICRDRTGSESEIAFAKTMVHEFCHAYMDAVIYFGRDELYHCIEESYANALTLRVFQTYAHETNNYLSGIGRKSTMTVVKELMLKQSKDYALGVTLFEKAAYFPERWRKSKSVVSGRLPDYKDAYLDVVYLRTHHNMCIANILGTINVLL